ncbi:MAG: type IV pilus secretin PilQ [Desulfobacterales bacterium]|nr:type IV pilus secretin PilQ [Desulfobacterales bacterium]
MGYYQAAFKQYKTVVTGVLLVVFLAAGCATHKSENLTQDETGQADVQAGAMASDTALRQIQGIFVETDENRLEVWIQGSEKLEYTSIKQPFPFAVSVYLPDTVFTEGAVPAPVSDSRISGVKTGYADKEKTTAKVEILLNRDLPYQVREEGSRLGIILRGEPASADKTADKGISPVLSDTGGTEVKEAGGDENIQTGIPKISGETAEMTHIEFDTQPSGHSDIRIRTTRPVRYETRQISADQLVLILYNTKIPEHHQRPLLTRYFNSAVEQVNPEPVSGMSRDSRIDIRIREQVPFRVVQNNSGIQMAFEPSSVVPPRFDKAKKELISGTGQTEMTKGQPSAEPRGLVPVQNQEAFSSPAPVSGRPEGPGNQVSGFTGEKIKLDFFETDIKNVFRILRSVSGLNFAIDGDVQGKVTLSLQEPLPWDQVLDLVLKMNSLGKTMEGNVVRIATAETLKKEEQMIQDAIAARKKAEEQKVALEPLVTEYIPINYSDATADIQPHVTQILTPDRGRVSVDTRTNMLIITDTQAKIDQAHDLIYRLDTVTPQIMIEARVVEVTKEFSRSIGLDWNLSNDASVTSGFVDDYNVSVNGATVGLSGDFSFFRLFGSSVTALNAQLEASEQMGDVRIISSPRILTLDNKKAMIKQGQEFAYLERDDSGGSSVEFKEIDLLLEVTPHVTPDKRISMTVHLTKNDVASVTADGVPTLATNEAQTELLVNNNDTVVIGGVVKTTQSADNDGIPFLTGIPILGYLFATKAEVDNRSELLIFLTPSIVQLEQKKFGDTAN